MYECKIKIMNGYFLAHEIDDQDKFKWVKKELKDISSYLNCVVEFHHGVKFKTIIDIFKTNIDFYASLFNEPYLHSNVYEEGCTEDTNIKSVKYKWYMEMNVEKSFVLSLDITGSGVGTGFIEEEGKLSIVDNAEEVDNFSFALAPLNSYLHCNIILDNKTDHILYGEKDIQVTEFGEYRTTLIDILNVTAYEFTFVGYPYDRDNVSRKMLNMIESSESSDDVE